MFSLSFSEHLDCLSNHSNYFGDGSLLNFIHFLLLSLSESDFNDLLDLVKYDRGSRDRSRDQCQEG